MIIAMARGNLTKDFEKKTITKELKDGTTKQYLVCSDVSLAFTEYGEDAPVFIRLVVWGNDIDRYAKYLKKGDSVTVTGKLQQREYKTSSGEKKQVLEFKEVYNIDKIFFKKKDKEEKNPDETAKANDVLPDVIGELDSFVDIPEFDDEAGDMPF